MKRYNSKYLWGVLLILLGVFVVLRSFDIINGNIFFDGWWTLFIIVPSVINLIFNNNRVWDASVLLVGIGFFLAANDLYVTYSNVWAIALCLVLVNIGISIMRGNRVRQTKNIDVVRAGKSSGPYIGIFSGCDEKPFEFYGGTAVAVFGSVDLDLRDIVFNEDVYLTAVSVFGGIDIYVNDNINVVCSTANIFGGSDNHQQPIAGNHTLYIDGCSVFSGVDIKKNKKS